MADVGRPLKFKSVEELDGQSDGFFAFCGDKLCTNQFAKEKDVEDFISNNIELFTKDILNDELISFEIDASIRKPHGFAPRGRRVDLVVQGKKKLYIIELKNPLSGTENRAAIGQILDYGREYLDSKKELIIITTKFDTNTAKTIKYYNLPIRYIYMDKKRFLEFVEDKKND
jgi:hypothetical protein